MLVGYNGTGEIPAVPKVIAHSQEHDDQNSDPKHFSFH
jgi:hypothetical protein